MDGHGEPNQCRSCAWWRGYFIDNPCRRILHKPEQILAPFVLPGMSTMDVGCGMGYFAIPMARLVGESGCVVAVELQQERLDVLMSRAAHAGVASQIRPVKCEPGDLRAEATVDFALAFYVIHETADPATVLRQVRGCVKDGGALLIAEPSFEVGARQFDATLELARAAAFTVARRFSLRLTRAALLQAE